MLPVKSSAPQVSSFTVYPYFSAPKLLPPCRLQVCASTAGISLHYNADRESEKKKMNYSFTLRQTWMAWLQLLAASVVEFYLNIRAICSVCTLIHLYYQRYVTKTGLLHLICWRRHVFFKVHLNGIHQLVPGDLPAKGLKRKSPALPVRPSGGCWDALGFALWSKFFVLTSSRP